MRSLVVALCWGVLSLWVATTVGAQVQSPSVGEAPLVVQSPLSLDVSGTVSFGLKYGLGDGRGLAQSGYGQGFLFNQLLALNLNGDVPVNFPVKGVFSVAAQLNSQQADNLQSLVMHFDSEHWLADFGDFFVGENAPQFIVPDRKLKGFKLQGVWDTFEATGAFARIEGLAQSKTFRGNTSSETTVFSANEPERPWLAQRYLRNVQGLEYYELSAAFVEGFSKVKLDLNPGPKLTTLLTSYGLDYVLAGIEADGPSELDEAQFELVRSEGHTYIVLKREALSLLRNRLRQAIDDYNGLQKLQGEQRKGYPFNEDTDFELGFLQQLQQLATLDVDEAALGLGDYERRRFFFLGRQKVDPDTLVVEVNLGDEWVDVNALQPQGYDVRLYDTSGLVAFRFPEAFFEDATNQVRATFSYTSSSGVYVLGLSIVKGSDKVFLNGAQLQRDTDYTIDYESGALILFKQVSRSDALRIEYEVLRGGLGGFAEYQRNLSQLSLNLKPQPWLSVNLDLFQGADVNSGEERSKLRTMPNTHTVIGARSAAELGPWKAALTLGYTINAFPQDHNLRINLPNRINAIRVLNYGGKTYVLFAHQNGLSVFDGVHWTLYNTRSGLSGRSVADIALNANWVALASEAGLTLVRLQGDDPFALNANWQRFYSQDGLADNRVRAVAFDGDWLWVGTEDGLSKVNTNVELRAFEEPKRWTSYQQKAFEALLSPAVTQLAVLEGQVYVGSERGLQLFDPQAERFRTDVALKGAAVHDLWANKGVLYAASERGLRPFVGGRGSGWVVSGQPVFAVAGDAQQLWYALERGLGTTGAENVPRELGDVTVSALAFANNALWVGPLAAQPPEAPEYPLAVARLSAEGFNSYTSRTTRIDGRDRGRFRDAPLLGDGADARRLDLGWLGQLQLGYTLGGLELSSALEGRSSGFSAIGDTAFRREDYLRWRLRSDYTLASLNVYAEHISGLGNPTVTDKLGFTWDVGFRLSLDYSEERRAEDRSKASFALKFSQDFFNDMLSLRLSLDDQGTRTLRRRESRSQDLTLSGSVGLQLGRGLRLSLGLRGPLHTRTHVRPSGSLNANAELSWTPQWEVGALSMNYKHESGLRLPRGTTSSQDTLDAQMTWQQLRWDDVLFVPHTELTFDQQSDRATDQVSTMSLSNGAQVRWQALSLRLDWGRDQSFSLINQTENVQDNVSARLDYSGFEQFSPGLDWNLNANGLRHAEQRKLALEQQWTARLGWTPAGRFSASASLSGDVIDNDEERSGSYGAHLNVAYRLSDSFDLSWALNGSLGQGGRGDKPFSSHAFDSALQGNWGFAKDWTASFNLGALAGGDSDHLGPDYLSFTASADAAMTF